MYKYSDDYDGILNFSCDMEFIENFLKSNKDINVAQHQLRKIYELEAKAKKNELLENNRKISINDEFELLNIVYMRNLSLINYCTFKVLNLPNNQKSSVLNEYEELIKEYHIKCLKKVCEICNKTINNIILGKEINVSEYQKALEQFLESENKNK